MISITRSALRLWSFTCSVIVAVLYLSVISSASAQGNSSIASEFRTKDPNVTAASLVGTQEDDLSSIELSSQSRAQKLIGVVSDEPLIELSKTTAGVQVVTSGLTMALVSDINGDIKAGDRITPSPIKGVGMKATESVMTVGTAQSKLELGKAETRYIADITGKDVAVHIGLVPVQVNVAFYSPETKESNSFVPSFLQSLANTVAGRAVSPARVLIASLIVLLLFTSVIVLLYSSVRSSIISIGRNPLSENAVRKSLIQVSLVVAGVLLCMVGLTYLVLTV